ADTVETARVWYGEAQQVSLGVAEDVVLTLPRGSRKQLQANMRVNDSLKAPIASGDQLGVLTVSLDDEVLVEVPLVARESVAQAGFFARIMDAIKLFLTNLFS